MSKKLTKTQIVSTIEDALKREQVFVTDNDTETNPQIVTMVDKAKGRIDAYENVLYALTYNSLSMLK